MTDAAGTVPFAEWDGTFSTWLRDAVDADWTAAVQHRFVTGLLAGDLPEQVLRTYLVQDYQFIDRFVALLGAAVAVADGYPARVVLANQLGVVAGEENTYFQRAFDALGVADADRTDPHQLPPTRAFNELMDSARGSMDYARCLAVLTVAEWLYLDWGQRATQHLPDDFVYREWIVLHNAPDFAAWVDWLRAELDRIGPSLTEQQQRACLADFARATTLEREFFDAAYA